MKLKNVILLILGVALFTGLLTYYIYEKAFILEVKEIPCDLNVTNANKVGFNLDKDAIHFGVVTNGGSSERGLELRNSKNLRVEIRARADGTIKDFLVFEPKKINLYYDENETMKVIAVVPKNAAPGGYSGKIILETRWKPI